MVPNFSELTKHSGKTGRAMHNLIKMLTKHLMSFHREHPHA